MQNLFTTKERQQPWAEHSPIRFPGLASETNVSGCSFSGYQSVNEYGWRECILIPFELFYKHVRKFTFKPRTLKTCIPKNKPLLFCNRTIVPLRI